MGGQKTVAGVFMLPLICGNNTTPQEGPRVQRWMETFLGLPPPSFAAAAAGVEVWSQVTAAQYCQVLQDNTGASDSGVLDQPHRLNAR
jgi:hypothetical protein